MWVVPGYCVTACWTNVREIRRYYNVLEREPGKQKQKQMENLLGIPRIPDRNSDVSASGEKTLYRFSFSSVCGLMTVRRVLILKKPGLPQPFVGSEGI